jgi:hypothetical protein
MAVVTVHDRLVALGADERQVRVVMELLGGILPVGRPVAVTDQVLSAALAGDAVLAAMLLAVEVAPDEDERAALRQLEEGPATDRERLPLDVQ